MANFYRRQVDVSPKSFVSAVFKACLEKIHTYDDPLFDSVYNLKILINYDTNSMGYSFIEKTHQKFTLHFCQNDLNAAETKIDKAKRYEENSKTTVFKRIFFLAKHILKTLVFSHCLLIFIPIVWGVSLLIVPEKFWKYISLLTKINSWNIMLYALIFLIFISQLFYVVPYIVMRKNTVHLNGFSNKDSIFVSFLCVSTIILPILLFVCLSIFV